MLVLTIQDLHSVKTKHNDKEEKYSPVVEIHL